MPFIDLFEYWDSITIIASVLMLFVIIVLTQSKEVDKSAFFKNYHKFYKLTMFILIAYFTMLLFK